MLGRKVSVPLVAALLLIGGCGGDGNAGGEPGQGTEDGITRQIAGGWTGELHQKGLAPFEIAVDIASDGTGQVAYTGIECGGGWTLDDVLTSIPPRYLFIEDIEKGSGRTCKGTGTVSLAPIQRHSPNRPAYTRLNYSFTGGGVTSRGLLHRAHTAGLATVFRQAGLPPPAVEPPGVSEP
jgi:hypothetical protein